MKRSPLDWDKVRDGKLPGHRLEQHESKWDFLTFPIWTVGERLSEDSLAGDIESGEECRACSPPGPLSAATRYQLLGSPESLRFRSHTLKRPHGHTGHM